MDEYQAEQLSYYLKSRKIIGAERVLVRDMVREGKNDLEIDFAMIDHGSEEVSEFVAKGVMTEVVNRECLVKMINSDVNAGMSVSKEYVEAAAEAQKDARYLRNGLRKVFPNIDLDKITQEE